MFLLMMAGAKIPHVAYSEDWPQFQGPQRNGVSTEKNLLREWPESGPPVLWSASIGPGFAGASISDGEVYLLDRVAQEADLLRCFDLESGKELRRHQYEVPGRLSYPGSRSIPTVDGDRVYTVGSFGNIYCWNRKTFEPVWHISFQEVYETMPPRWGYAQSPVIIGDLVYVAPMTEEVGLIALDKHSGKVVWESEAVGQSYCTPMLAEIHGISQLLFISSNEDRIGIISSIDPQTGEIIWQYKGYGARHVIPAPFAISGNRIFITSGYGSGSSLIEVLKDGEAYDFREIFYTELGSQVHLPVFHENHLYFLANENGNQRNSRHEEGGLTCMNLDGTVDWRTGNAPNFGRGNMIFADGMLIILDGIDGTLRLIEPQSAGYRQIAEAPIFDTETRDGEDQQMWAPMALSEGKLVLRSQNLLKCVDLRKR